jgi:hypothetical protein
MFGGDESAFTMARQEADEQFQQFLDKIPEGDQ